MPSQRRTWTLLVGLLAAFSMIAAACGDDDDPGATDTEPAEETTEEDTEETTEGGGESTAQGVTADTIKVGYSYLDFDELVERGLSPSGWGDQELAMRALVDALNEEGGINGRQLEVVYEPYSALGVESAEAVCLRLTEDEGVFAVLGGFLGPAEPANVCIAGRQETVLNGGVQSEARLEEVTAPWITDRPLRTRQADILLTLLEDEGMLEDASVALVTNIDAEDVRDDVRAALEEAGVEPVEDLVIDAPIGDLVAEDTVWAGIAERIRASDANTVLVAGNPSSSIRNIASQGLDVDIWALDQESLLSLGTSVDPETARGTLAAAPLTGDELFEDETVQDCKEIFTEANPDIELTAPSELTEGDEDVFQGLVVACRFLRLFQTAADAAGEELTRESFAAAVEELGEFSIPGQPFASLGPEKFDSNDSFRLVSYNPDIGQDGGFDELTDVQDVTP